MDDGEKVPLATYRFDFTGRTGEYFRIWVVSLSLSVVTFGIYSAWGKVLAGDAVGTTILAAALPAVLLRTRYSRQFEVEADDYAFAMLKRHGQSPQAFADLLRRLSLIEPETGDSHSLRRYLSTHPATEERIQHAEEQR